MPPVKNPCVTSYGGIIRIRLKGRSSVTSSQPASQAPLYLFRFILYTYHFENTIVFLKKRIVRVVDYHCFIVLQILLCHYKKEV